MAKSKKLPAPKRGDKYTQSELFSVIQERCELGSKKDAKLAYEALTSFLHQSLKKGYSVPLPGLGKILVVKRKARMARNPQTGEPVRVPAKKQVKLRPNKALKDAVL